MKIYSSISQNTHYVDELFPAPWASLDFKKSEGLEVEERIEKSETMVSLHKFLDKNIEENARVLLGEQDLPTPSLSENLSADIKQHPSAPLKALYWGDVPRPGEEDLLEKMIRAMGLNQNEIIRASLSDDHQDEAESNADWLTRSKEKALRLIAEYHPQVVISLGAKACQVFFGKKEKLAKIRGQFFDFTLRSSGEASPFETKIIPIFHPDLLKINPNMKKTAWHDLQKIMQYIDTLGHN